jgi:hypothetical protein
MQYGIAFPWQIDVFYYQINISRLFTFRRKETDLLRQFLPTAAPYVVRRSKIIRTHSNFVNFITGLLLVHTTTRIIL